MVESALGFFICKIRIMALLPSNFRKGEIEFSALKTEID
jgi:hypothetical protein